MENNLNTSKNDNVENVNPLSGVKGWLQLFVYVNLYIAPAFAVISSLLMFTGLVATQKLDSVVFAILIITTIVDLIFVVYGVVVALALRDIKPGAVKKTKLLLVLKLAWLVANHATIFLFYNSYYAFSPKVYLYMAGIAVWLVYFSISKRVQATYGIDEVN